MHAWTTRMRMKMQALRSRCLGTTTVKTRFGTWTDAMVDRLVCCGGRDSVFDEDEEEDGDTQDEEIQNDEAKEHISATDERTHEPQAEPKADDASDDEEDESFSANQDDTTHMNAVGGDASDCQPAAEASIKCVDCLGDATTQLAPTPTHMTETTTMNEPRAVRVLQRFLRSCVSSHRQRLSIANHVNASVQGKTTLAEDSNEERTISPRVQFPLRLHLPQVYPLSHSPPSNSPHARSLLSTLRNPLAAKVDSVRSARSPSSSLSSTDSRCSSRASASSWSDTHSDLVAENAVLRKRLEATPPRVYDFETDPRNMSQQQMRRLAILRHRDATRAKLLEKQMEGSSNRPQWR